MVKLYDELPYTDSGTVDYERWISDIGSYFPADEKDKIRSAVLLVHDLGNNSKTIVGQTYFEQGLKTAQVLLKLQPDIHTLLAAIVYLCVQGEKVSLEDIETQLGSKVSALVGGIVQLSSTEPTVWDNNTDTPEVVAGQSQRDNIRKMLLAIVEDVRVVLIKLSEQVVLLRETPKDAVDTAQEIATQVKNIYAPLANRLGIGQIKWELEDLSFRYLDGNHYKNIAKLLDEKRGDRESYIKRSVEIINETLQSNNIDAQVNGRAKHIYSIWRKMSRKGLEFSDIYDVRAIRILVDGISECYTVLGLIHNLWQYIPKEFDDYIATPKENGYRSLHTAVIGPEGKNLEVQIRTHQMHKEAELGVAAHWLYKEGLRHDSSYHTKLATLRQILDWQEEVDTNNEGSDNVQYAELFDDRVYVFTPRGDVVDLPKGATPIDFAYHIHSEVGHRCRGAKINGAMVSLIYNLRSGDQIEILTSKHPKPSRDWLNPHLGYVNTSRAKAKIQAWFRLQDRDKNILEGKEMLDKECKRLGMNKVDLLSAAKRFNMAKDEDVLAGLGRGDIKLGQLVSEQHTLSKDTDQIDVQAPSRYLNTSQIQILGIGNMLFSFAKCCKPLPGDPIVGYITSGRGVTIHRDDCVNMFSEDQHREDRCIQVSWGKASQTLYPVDIGIVAYDRKGLLSDISSVLAKEQVNVTQVTTSSSKDNTALLFLTLQIDNLSTLGKILTKILQVPNVIEAYRVKEG
ncbi:MAG: GTP diphosphokinase [Legionellales bacterium]|nr:GTP diphosphokinase [Legionellales bacterium]